MFRYSLLVVLWGSLFTSFSSSLAEDDMNKIFSNLNERKRFESLLAGGRSLAFPFATGLIISLVSAEMENWNVSINGLREILNVDPHQLVPTYCTALEEIKKGNNSKYTSTIYPLTNGWKNFTTAFKSLQISVKPLSNEDKFSNETWDELNSNVKENSEGLLDEKLIPKSAEVGNPFKFSTQAVLISTFHHKTAWKNPWRSGESEVFGDSFVPFLQYDGEVGYTDVPDFSAINIPLRGDLMSVVFILPKINLTQYLKTSKNPYFLIRSGVDEADFVPFPTNWIKRDLSIHIPSFNLSATEQYGKELTELGMNQTFCTTLVDRTGSIPYYLRPIVQVNSAIFTKDHIEIASATGAALERFYFGLDFSGVGYPRTAATSKADVKSIQAYNEEVKDENSKEVETTTIIPDGREKFTLNKPFLWYLNDKFLGPLFYGMVESMTFEENIQDPMENSRYTEEAVKYLLWSCKSFKQSGQSDEIRNLKT